MDRKGIFYKFDMSVFVFRSSDVRSWLECGGRYLQKVLQHLSQYTIFRMVKCWFETHLSSRGIMLFIEKSKNTIYELLKISDITNW